MRVNEEIVGRHVADAAFLWGRRARALRTSRLSHAERVDLDRRLGAHVEGALLGGAVARAAAEHLLDDASEPGTIFAGAVLAAPARELPEGLLEAVASDPLRFAGCVSALGWHPRAAVEPLLRTWAAGAADATLTRLGLAGLTAHRLPVAGELLHRALRAASPATRAVAAKAVGELAAHEHAAGLEALANGDESEPRFQAARALARLGYRGPHVLGALFTIAESDARRGERAADALARSAGEEGRGLLDRWSREPSKRYLALAVAEALGTVEAADHVIPWMGDDALARGAGEVFRSITGVDYAAEGLSRPRPSPAPGDPNDDPMDPVVELPLYYELPFPAPERVAQWWAARRGKFDGSLRYVAGRAVGSNAGWHSEDRANAARRVARTGRPRHQMLAARALAFTLTREVTIETEAFVEQLA